MYRSLAVTAFHPRFLHLCNQVTFKPGQKLYMVNRLYPYTLQFREESTSAGASGEKSKAMKRPHQRDAHEERDQDKEKSCRVSAPSCSNSAARPDQTHAPEKVGLAPHLVFVFKSFTLLTLLIYVTEGDQTGPRFKLLHKRSSSIISAEDRIRPVT